MDIVGSPFLYDAGGDLSKQWFIIYYVIRHGRKKRIRESKGLNTLKSQRERRAYASKRIAQLTRQVKKELPQPKEKRKNLLTLFEEVYQVKKRTTRKGTYRMYPTVLRYLGAFLEGEGEKSILPEQFTPSHALRFRNHLITKGGDTGPLESKTIHNYMVILSAVFSELMLDDANKILKHPCKGLPKLRIEQGTHEVYHPADLAKILDYAQQFEPYLLCFIQFLFYTLNRPTAVRHLRIGDIDLEQRKIRFLHGHAKSRKTGYVVIPDGLHALIESMELERYPRNYYVFGKHYRPGPEVIYKDYFYRRNRHVLKKLAMQGQGYTLYSWKHTGAVQLYNKIKDIKRVSEQCLHHDVTVTMKYLKGLGVIFGSEELRSEFPRLL